MFTGCKEGTSPRPLPDRPNQHDFERALGHQAFFEPPRSLVNNPPVAQGASTRGCSGPPADTPGVHPWSPGTVFSGLFPGGECGLSCGLGLQVETWVTHSLSFGPPGPVFTLFLPSSPAPTPKLRVPASGTMPLPHLPELLCDLHPPAYLGSQAWSTVILLRSVLYFHLSYF